MGIVFGAKGGRSISATLSRIPDAPGIYAWHNSLANALPHDDPSANLAALTRLIEKPHCLERRARLGPAHEVSLSSKRTLNKSEQLLEALSSSSFLDALKTALTFSVFLQAPLYIGKASKSLRARVGQHLHHKTPLAERLAVAGIDITECSVLYIQSQTPSLRTEHEDNQNDNIHPTLESDDELLFEEVASKLFLPTFTQRFG
jgi:hypothetical protein